MHLTMLIAYPYPEHPLQNQGSSEPVLKKTLNLVFPICDNGGCHAWLLCPNLTQSHHFEGCCLQRGAWMAGSQLVVVVVAMIIDSCLVSPCRCCCGWRRRGCWWRTGCRGGWTCASMWWQTCDDTTKNTRASSEANKEDGKGVK